MYWPFAINHIRYTGGHICFHLISLFCRQAACFYALFQTLGHLLDQEVFERLLRHTLFFSNSYQSFSLFHCRTESRLIYFQEGQQLSLIFLKSLHPRSILFAYKGMPLVISGILLVCSDRRHRNSIYSNHGSNAKRQKPFFIFVHKSSTILSLLFFGAMVVL